MSDDSTNPQNDPQDAVIPPPPPETPVPDDLIPPPPPEKPVPDGLIEPSSAAIAPADAVIPPPPPEAMLPTSRRASRNPSLSGDQPSAAAHDWAEPSVAPQTSSSGDYRVLAGVIFTVLVLLLVAAVAVGIYLLTNVPLPFVGAEGAAVAATALVL